MRLLVLEDDSTLGEALQEFLRMDGHVVDWCRTLSQASVLAREPYDIWLLDWNLPDGSGVDWLRSQRIKGMTTAAIVLTARDQLQDRIAGLDGGADDFMVKPFAPEELSARLRAFSRRLAGSAERKRIGRVEVDIAAKSAWLNGVHVDLTAREWAILEALVLRAGRIVAATDLEALVMGLEGDIASNALQVHIHKLRSKLGKGLIETIRGLGYRLGADEAK